MVVGKAYNIKNKSIHIKIFRGGIHPLTKLEFEKDQIVSAIEKIVDRTFKMDNIKDWPAGVAFFGVTQAYETTKNEEYLTLLQNWIDEQKYDM